MHHAALEKNTMEMRSVFGKQLSLLKTLAKMDDGGRLSDMRIVAGSSCSTGSAIHCLGSNPELFLAEMTMLARSYIEKITNYCFLLVCNDDEFEDFVLHPFYKAFHSLDRKRKAGDVEIGIKFSGIEHAKQNSDIKAALKRFGEKDGRSDWSKLSVHQKIDRIHQAAPSVKIEFFLMNTVTLYSNASEALHGSLYGCSFHIGAFDPTVDSSDIECVKESVYKNTALIYAQLSSITDELIQLKEMSRPNGSVAIESKETQEQIVTLMKKIFG